METWPVISLACYAFLEMICINAYCCCTSTFEETSFLRTLQVCISTPLFAAVVPVLAILYYFIQRAFVPSSRQIKRLEAVSRSPILSHFQESLHGQAVIRAMNQQDRFIQISDHLNDVHNMSSYANAVGQRYVTWVRIDLLRSRLLPVTLHVKQSLLYESKKLKSKLPKRKRFSGFICVAWWWHL